LPAAFSLWVIDPLVFAIYGFHVIERAKRESLSSGTGHLAPGTCTSTWYLIELP
jgi:hypothetical protein